MTGLQAPEWLETNGTGGFACGSWDGVVRRKWHGLWVARRPPRDRARLLAGWQITARLAGGVVSLTGTWRAGRWASPAVAPVVTTWPVPQWRWDIPGADGPVNATLILPHGTQGTAELALLAPAGVHLAVRPILPHLATAIRVDNAAAVVMAGTGVEPVRLDTVGDWEIEGQVEPLGVVDLELEVDCEDVASEAQWLGPTLLYRGGAPGLLRMRWAALDSPEAWGSSGMASEEVARREALPVPAGSPRPMGLAADQFIVRGTSGRPTVLAGYPWFTDWGRDSMIALPGLLLRSGRIEEARDIVRHFLEHLCGGLIPNLFPEADPPKYNTVDATLWLVEMMRRCWTAAEIAGAPLLADSLASIIAHHRRGTHNATREQADGLLAAGTPGTQLTWMDVKVNGHVPTPRHGKAVEIQGLWYNAQLIAAEVEEAAHRPAAAAATRRAAARTAASFARRFALAGHDHLADVVDRDHPWHVDPALRPNQAIPFALRHNIIPVAWRPRVLRTVANRLLTPRGLRTLDPADPRYHGIYRGNVVARDHAYHQGTVWMWLLWPWARGVADHAAQVPDLAAGLPALAAALREHFDGEACANSCSEIFDADAPHRPRGCFAQAWSVAAMAEVLAIVERLGRD